MRTFARRAFFAAALLAGGYGCTAILGIETDYKLEGSGGSTSSSATGTTTSVSTSSVTTSSTSATTSTGTCSDIDGTSKITHVTSTVQSPTPVNFAATGQTIKAYDANFNVYTGSGLSDGTFKIACVPAGRYLLDIDGDYHSLTTRTPDLSRAQLGRVDVVADSVQGTDYTFDVTNMVPWANGDGIQLFSASAGVISFNMLTSQTTNVPKPNDVTLASTDSWFFTIEPDNLIQADTTTLAQFVQNTTSGGQPYLTIGAFTTLPAFSIVTGQANTISGSFVQKTPGPSVNVSFTRSKFAAMLNEIGPGASIASAGYFLEPLPGGTLSTGPFVPEQPQVISLTTTTDITNEAIQYNNPYPAGWTLTERGELSFGVPVTLSGHAPGTFFALVSTSRQAVVGGTAIVPFVGPAHAPTVDGAAFSAGGTLATQPTIAWSAPTDGANMPDHYVVGVRALGVAGNGSTKFIFLANFATDTTSVKLPPGLLMAGTSYFFTIRSHYAAGASYETQPNADNFPRGIADVVSGVFTVPSAGG